MWSGSDIIATCRVHCDPWRRIYNVVHGPWAGSQARTNRRSGRRFLPTAPPPGLWMVYSCHMHTSSFLIYERAFPSPEAIDVFAVCCRSGPSILPRYLPHCHRHPPCHCCYYSHYRRCLNHVASHRLLNIQFYWYMSLLLRDFSWLLVFTGKNRKTICDTISGRGPRYSYRYICTGLSTRLIAPNWILRNRYHDEG